MVFLLKLVLFTFFTFLTLNQNAYAIRGSDLLPHHTYFILAGVKAPSNHYQVQYLTSAGPEELFFSGNTLEEINLSIQQALADRTKLSGKPDQFLITHSRVPLLSLEASKRAEITEVVGRQIKKVAPDAKSFQFFSLGTFGIGKLVQMIPIVTRTQPSSSERFETQLSDGSWIEVISAQVWTLTFKYNPYSFAIMADQGWMSFRRGPCFTFHESFRFIDFQLPDLDDGSTLNGTNLLGNLTARRTSPTLTDFQRYAMSPPDHQIETRISLGDAISALPNEIQFQMIDLFTKTAETIRVAVQSPGERDLKAEQIEAEARGMKPLLLSFFPEARPTHFKQNFNLATTIRYEVEQRGTPDPLPAQEEVKFGPFERTSRTAYAQEVQLGLSRLSPQLRIEVSGSLEIGKFHLSARLAGIDLPIVGHSPPPRIDYDFFTDALPTDSALTPVSLTPDATGIRRFGDIETDPRKLGKRIVVINLAPLGFPEGIKNVQIEIPNSFHISESRLSSPPLTPSPKERGSPDPSPRSPTSTGGSAAATNGATDPSPAGSRAEAPKVEKKRTCGGLF
jgi:hypothetical protein